MAVSIVFIFIKNLPRKLTGFICISAAGIFFTLIFFLKINPNCPYCTENIVSISIFFVLRIITTFYYPILNVYNVEVFPLRARSSGLGISHTFGAAGEISCQYILLFLKHTPINPIWALILVSIFGVLSICLLPETLNKPLED